MKEEDIKIFACLRSNARISLTKISKKTGVPISTIFDKVRSAEGNLIKKYATILDYGMLGFNIWTKIFLKAGFGKKEELKIHLLKHFNVNSLFKVNNGHDFMAECIFKNIMELEEFLENLESCFGAKNPEVHYMLENLKTEAFLSDTEIAGFILN